MNIRAKVHSMFARSPRVTFPKNGLQVCGYHAVPGGI